MKEKKRVNRELLITVYAGFLGISQRKFVKMMGFVNVKEALTIEEELFKSQFEWFTTKLATLKKGII